MKTKFKLRNILMISALAFAGLFGISAFSIDKQKDELATEKEAKADTGPIYETVGSVQYRILYFHVHSSIEASQYFGDTSQSNGWGYQYSTNSGSSYSSKVLFGSTSDSNTKNEIIGDFTVKMYLNSSVTHIRFGTRGMGSNYMRTPNIELNGAGLRKQAYWINEDNWNTKEFDGEWITKNDFFSRFHVNYFTVSSSWHDGNSISALGADWIRVHFDYNSSEVQRGTLITTTGGTIHQFTNSSSYYVKFLYPKDAKEIFLSDCYNGESYRSVGEHKTPVDNYLYNITSAKDWYNNWPQDVTYQQFNNIQFARFYFCDNNWGDCDNPRIGTQDLQDHFSDSTLFVLTGTASSYAALDVPSRVYYYIDFPLTEPSTLYFRFEQNGVNWYPTDSGYKGNLPGTFSPGYIYQLSPGTYRGESGSNKWCDITVNTLGYFGRFDNDGGTRNASESYDYKEFRTSANILKAPTKDGYTFIGWRSSTNCFVDKPNSSYTASVPTVFTAVWMSNTQTIVAGDKVRIWIGYDGNLDSVFYKDSAIIKIMLNNGVTQYE